MIVLRPSSREDYEIAIICALPLEYDAITFLFDEFWDDNGNPYGKAAGDPNNYTTGRIGTHNIVLALLYRMGKASAAGAVASMRSSYSNLRLAFLVGVCGGVPRAGDDEILLGDVVISKTVVQYDFGRQYPDKFVRKDSIGENLGRPNRDIRNLLASFETNLGLEQLQKKTAYFLDELQINAARRKRQRHSYDYPGTVTDKLFEPSYRHKHRVLPMCICHDCNGKSDPVCDIALDSYCDDLGCDERHLVSRGRLEIKRRLEQDKCREVQEPAIYLGSIASGDTVMKSGDDRDRVAKNESVIAFEMEGAGVWEEMPCIIVKGVCDYADSHKNKRWQNFAAATAASVTKAILERYIQMDGPISYGMVAANPVIDYTVLPPHHIPFSKTRRFVGRDTTLEPLDQVLESRRVGVIGLGGIGRDHAQMSQGGNHNYYFNLALTTVLPVARDALFDSRAEEHNARCHPDTRIDLLHQIQTWADDPGGKCIFWLNGMAGAGKSTISRTVAGRFKEQAILGASFFFKRGERDRGSTALFFTTIAVQLASRIPYMARHVKSAIETDPTIPAKGLREQFERLILQPLDIVGYISSTIVIVVDALDECDHDDDIRLLIHLFSEARSLTSVRLRVFTTSRPELPIRLGFNDIRGRYQDVALHQTPDRVIEHDIAVFLRHKLAKIKGDYNSLTLGELQLPSNWPDEQDLQTLIHMAIPLFIFAATICRFVEDPIWSDPAGQLDKVLNYHTAGDFELSKLDATYLPIVGQLVVGKTGSTKSSLINGFRDIVGPIVLLAEPLSISSLSRVLDVPTVSIARRLSLLHSVLSVPSDAHSPIRPFHLSFRDFLTNSANPHEFWIDEKETHRKLAARCLCLLKSNLKENICHLKMPGTRRAEVSPETIIASLPAHIQYACRYWVHHLEQSKSCITDTDQVHWFLTHHFLHWLEALCFMGRISESIQMIHTLQARVTSRYDEVSAFLYDANRFLLKCLPFIDVAPLQLYCSAIIFLPKNSVIQDISKVPKWIITKPAMEEDWSPCLQILDAHSTIVTSIVFSPDGTRFLSASEDGTVNIWDLVTGRCLQTLGHGPHITSVAFSPDGTRLVSTSVDKTVKIWDSAIGSNLQTLEGQSDQITVAFSPDGIFLASASGGHTVKIWEPTKGHCLQTLGHNEPVHSAIFSFDGSRLASLCSGAIRIWDPETGRCLQTLIHSTSVRSVVAFSSSSIFLASASASEDDTVQIWDLATGFCLHTLKGHRHVVESVAFSPNSTRLASASQDNTIKIWDLATGRCLQTLNGHSDCVFSVTFSPDGARLVSGSDDGAVTIWDLTTGSYPQTFESHDDPIASVAFSPDGTRLASTPGNENGLPLHDCSVKIWDLATGHCLQTLKGHINEVTSVVFSPNGVWLASSSFDCTVKIWDLATGSSLQTLEDHNMWVNSIAFSPNGMRLASAADDHTIKIWDSATGSCLQTLKGHTDSVKSANFSPNGMRLASASLDHTVKIWDPTTGSCLKTLKGHSGFIWSTTFSPNSMWLASASLDHTVKIWDPATGSCLQTLKGHNDSVKSAAFSPNSMRLASASRDRTVKIWDPARSRCLQTFHSCPYRKFVSLSFNGANSSLHTDFGTIRLGEQSTLNQLSSESTGYNSQEGQELQPHYQGYGISIDENWITWNSDNVLWLPPEYRPKCSAISQPQTDLTQATTVVLGCSSGRVLIFQFLPQEVSISS